MVAIGVVNEGYDTSEMPGRKNGTVGYQIDGNVYDTENDNLGRATKGINYKKQQIWKFLYGIIVRVRLVPKIIVGDD